MHERPLDPVPSEAPQAELLPDARDLSCLYALMGYGVHAAYYEDQLVLHELVDYFGVAPPSGPPLPKQQTISTERLAERLANTLQPSLMDLLLVAARLPGGKPAAGSAFGVAWAAFTHRRGAGQAALHHHMSSRVYRRHGVHYIDTPQTGVDDDSLRAWSLAWALERVVALGSQPQLRTSPEREKVAASIARHLRDIPKIVVGTSGKAAEKERNPPGVELLHLRQWLDRGVSPLEAASMFSSETSEHQKQRAHQGGKDLHKTTALAKTSDALRESIYKSSPRFSAESVLGDVEIADLINKAYDDTTANDRQTMRQGYEDLARLAIIVKERWQVAPTGSAEQAQFRHLLNFVEQHTARYLWQSLNYYLGKGAQLSVGTARLAYDMLHDRAWRAGWEPREQAQYEASRELLRGALVQAACDWLKQPRPGDKLVPLDHQKYDIFVDIFLHAITTLPPDAVQTTVGWTLQKERNTKLWAHYPTAVGAQAWMRVALPEGAKQYLDRHPKGRASV